MGRGWMKKYGILAVATILAIAGILAAGSFTKQPATEVTAFVLEAAPVEKKCRLQREH